MLTGHSVVEISQNSIPESTIPCKYLFVFLLQSAVASVRNTSVAKDVLGFRSFPDRKTFTVLSSPTGVSKLFTRIIRKITIFFLSSKHGTRFVSGKPALACHRRGFRKNKNRLSSYPDVVRFARNPKNR